MAIAVTNTFEPDIAPSRGGFQRGANDTPYIAHPTKTVKTGPRKGLPLRTPYGSFSSFAKLIENTFNLQKWGERQAMLGVGHNLALIADCHALTLLDKESAEFKEQADRIVVAAKNAAKASLSADRGTHAHGLGEDHDNGQSWIDRAAAGEDLGLDRDTQQSIVQAWSDMLEKFGLEVLAVEASCVDDDWRLAGTLDRIVRTTRDLRFSMLGGVIVIVPAGTILILDIKSGKLRLDTHGYPMYWLGYSIQVAGYGRSVPYDTALEQRGEWGFDISQKWALIAHLDVLGALDGNPSCNLILVDIATATQYGGKTVVAAKAWAARTDVFSVAQLDDIDQVSAPVEVPTIAPADATDVPSVDVEAPTSLHTSAGVPTAPADTADREAVEVSPHLLTSAGAPTPQEQHAQVCAQPDEGGPLHPDEYAVLKAQYLALNPFVRAWITDRFDEAKQHKVGFHLRANPSVRAGLLVHAMIVWGPHADDTDEMLRAVLSTILGEIAWFPAVTVGHLIGSLNAVQAAVFAARCDRAIGGIVPATIADTGHIVLGFDEPEPQQLLPP